MYWWIVNKDKTTGFSFIHVLLLGLDWGGLRREWVEVFCTELFNPEKSELFTRFTDNPQALVGFQKLLSLNIQI